MRIYKKTAWAIFSLSVISLLFLLVFRTDNVSSSPAGWDKTYTITPYDLKVRNMRLDYKGNIIALVFETEGDESGIYITLSFNKAKSFLKPIKIASGPFQIDKNPDIALSSRGFITVAWKDIDNLDSNSHVYYMQSKDIGATWSEPQRLQSPTEIELEPRILYDGRDRLHVFYNAYNEGAFNLFQVIQDDDKFQEPKSLILIEEGLRGAFFPAVYVSGRDMYLAWQAKAEKGDTLTDDLYLVRSGNYGRTWSPKELLTRNNSRDSSPFITSYGNNLYIAYQNNEKKNWAINLLKGDIEEEVWNEPVAISETNADCFFPYLVRNDDNDLFIIWYDTRMRVPGIFTRKMSLDSGKLSSEVMLSGENTPAKKPVAVSIDNRITVIWEQAGRIVMKGTDVYVKPPVVYSDTHSEDKWSKSATAVIKWRQSKDESGITGYATLLRRPSDPQEDLDPTVTNIAGNIREFRTPALEDGISYFYIRTIDGAGNYSRTIRYRLNVSRNPPAMPVVSSNTHPDGQSVDTKDADITWTIDDKIRIKGFLYSLSKGKINEPDKFTTETNIQFNDLNEGRYFFTIKSVDKTNTTSQLASYQIIVGKAERIDPTLYSQIARGIVDKKIEKKIVKKVLPKIPSIDIEMPFDVTRIYDRNSFSAEIKLKNLDEKDVIGYSFYIGNNDKLPLDRINLRDRTISVSSLKNGEYYLNAKAYFRSKDKNKDYMWTEAAGKRFTVETADLSPVLTFSGQLMERLSDNYAAVVLSLSGIFASILTLGIGGKISFYFKSAQMKLMNMFR